MKKLYSFLLAVSIAALSFGHLSAQTQADALAQALAQTQGATGQTDSVRIKGVIIDAKEKTPMQSAYVVLETARDTIKTLTNQNGEFLFSKVPRGVAKLNISFMGYSAYTLEFKADGVQMDFGEIGMTQGEMDLGEVSVVGHIEMMTSRGDTIVYNPAAFKTMAGDYAVDLIVKFPGIEISDDGSIKAHGETVKWALVDGKLMFGRDVMNTIENVKADDIEEVKIYDVVDPDKPGAEYARETEDMQRVIDFTTKSKLKGMLNARALGGVGKDLSDETEMTPDARHKMEGDFGLFNEKRVITLNALSNNTRDATSDARRRFMGGGRGSGYAGGGDGYGRRNSINIRLSNSNPFSDRNKWQGDLSYGFSNNYDYSYTIQEQIGLVENTLRRDSVESNSTVNTHNFGIGVRKRWENTSLNIDPVFTLGNGNNDSYTANWADKDDAFVSSLVRDNASTNNFFTTNGSIRFSQAIKLPELPVDSTLLEAGETLSSRRPISVNASVGWSYSNRNTNGLEDYDRVSVNTADNLTQLLVIDNNAKSDGATANLSVSGIGFTPWLYATANYAFNYTDSKTLNLYVDDLTGTINEGKTQILTNNNIRNSVGANFAFGKQDAKVTANLGVNYNATNNMRDESYPNDSYDRRLYQSVTPSFSIGNSQRNMSASKRYQWSAGYSTSSSNPSLEQTRDYVDASNDMYPVLGNPDLKQSYTHSVSSSLQISNTDKATSVNLNVSGRYVQDAITTQRVFIDQETVIDGVVIDAGDELTTYRNVSGEKGASAGVNFSRPFIGNKFVLNGGASYAFSYRPGYERDALVWNTEHAPGANIGIRSNHSAVIEYGITNGTSLGYTFTTGTNDFRTVRENLGANFRLRFLKNFTFEGDYAYSYYVRHVGEAEQEPIKTQLLNGSLSWDFAKRAGNLKFTVYDILNRNSSFTSAMNSQTLTNTWKQLMSRYCMLTVSFRFNKTYGGQGGGQSMRGPGEGGPGGFMGGPGGGGGAPQGSGGYGGGAR